MQTVQVDLKDSSFLFTCIFQILTFDEDQFDDQVMAGPLAGLNYQGINLGCQTAECQYVSLRNYPRYGSISAPHAMGFRARDLPSLSSAVQGGKVRLKTLYCAQTSGTTVPLTARGFIGGEVSHTNLRSKITTFDLKLHLTVNFMFIGSIRRNTQMHPKQLRNAQREHGATEHVKRFWFPSTG